MLRAGSLLLLLAAATGIAAPSNSDPALLFPLRIGKQYGYINRSGKLVLPARFDDARAFSEGRAPAKLNGAWGYLDAGGQFVIAPTYEAAWLFNEGRATVKAGGKYAHITTTGKILGDQLFEGAGNYSHGLSQIKRDGKYGYRDLTGRIVIPPRFSGAGPFMPNGTTWAVEAGRAGYIDRNGHWILPRRFHHVSLFSEGVAGVREHGAALFGFISPDGRMVIPPRFEFASGFADGLGSVKMNGKWGFIDHAGKIRIPCIFNEAMWFGEQRARVRIGRGWTFIDTSGHQIAPPRFAWCQDFRDGLALVSVGGVEGYLDLDGHFIWSPYRHALASAALPILVLLALAFLPGFVMRRIVARAMVAMKSGTRSTNVARLYRLRKIEGGMAVGAMIILALVSLAPFMHPIYRLESLWTGWIETFGYTGPGVSHMLRLIVGLIPVYGSYLFLASALFEVDRRVRHTAWTMAGFMAMHLRALLVGIAPILLYQAAGKWWPGAAAHPWLLFGGYLATIFTFSPILIHFVWRTRSITDKGILNTIDALSHRSGVHVTGVHLWSMPGGKIANAMISGLLPICRVVFLSDTLVEQFSPAEMRVILAHEFGHIKRRHLWWFAAFGIMYIVAAAAFWIVLNKIPAFGRLPAWTGPVLNLAFVLVYLTLIRNYFSRIFEFQADRYAVEMTGALRSFSSGMRKLARLNGQPREWSAWHGLVVTHPGMESRIKAVERAWSESHKKKNPGRR